MALLGTGSELYRDMHTVMPTKSDSDVIFCLKLLSKTLTFYNSLELTQIDISRVY